MREPRAPLRLAPGEVAVVPLSLAGSGPVSSLAVPPLTVRALGVRASARPDAARSFLEFLTGEKGNATFRACGRTEAR
jgi:ABC-type molybdate transport system substrate-binding protein